MLLGEIYIMRPFFPGVTSEVDKMNRSDLKKVNQYIQYYSAFGRVQIRFLRDTDISQYSSKF